MSIEHVTETTCPRCLMPYAIHEGDEVTTVCPNILKKMETVPSWPPVSLHQGGPVTNDIEAAARAVIEAWDAPESHDPDAAVEVLRSALAHAARGEGECAVVGSPEHVALWDAINEYARSVGGDPSRFKTVTRMNAVVDVEAAVREFRHTPPPATGEAGTSEVEKAGIAYHLILNGWIPCVTWDKPGVCVSMSEKEALAMTRALPEAREGGRS